MKNQFMRINDCIEYCITIMIDAGLQYCMQTDDYCLSAILHEILAIIILIT